MALPLASFPCVRGKVRMGADRFCPLPNPPPRYAQGRESSMPTIAGNKVSHLYAPTSGHSTAWCTPPAAAMTRSRRATRWVS